MKDSTRWYKPKLIEVAIPLEDINRESAREKSIRHGHPSTLHLWWARRPLAACRAVLFSQLVDDPSAHPDQFPTEEAQAAERERLHGIIKRLVVWENIHDEDLLKEARAEIWKSCGGNPPSILDPFAGGGSIPLEAQRLGLEAHASDLNPVAVLINKALIEIPPRWAGQPPVFPGAAEGAHSWPGATGLAEDVRRYGLWVRKEAEKRIGHLYPTARLPDGSKATVIAWFWARTIVCPNPACGGTIPLVRSFWLSTRKGKERYIQPVPDGKRVRFEIRGPSGVPHEGTVSRTGATCLLCGTPVQIAHLRAEGKAHRVGSELMAIAAEGPRRRYYLPPDEGHMKVADCPRPEEIPDAYLPHNPRWFSPPLYGIDSYADLFTNRQLTSLTVFADLVREVGVLAEEHAACSGLPREDAAAYGSAVATYLAFAVSKLADRGSSMCSWVIQRESNRNTFARQAIPMTWDFIEMNPMLRGTGSFAGAAAWTVESLDGVPAYGSGTAAQANAISQVGDSSSIISTDPPYYDNIGYADLSDFFYIWLRRSLGALFPEIMATVQTPKAEELVADPFRHGSKDKAEQFFESGFEQVFTKMCEGTLSNFPITVFYAFKQAEVDGDGWHASTGWETLLEGMLKAGWSITATWPMRTERTGRSIGIDTNALASSIVLACRPRLEDAAVTDKRGLIAALREELPDALRRLQQGGIAPVDLPQAAIGPGMAVFSRYARVNEPGGAAMTVRTALGLINQALDEVLAQQEGDFGADTRWCLEWYKTYGFDDGPFGVAETLSKAKNTSIAGLERAGVLWSRAGKVHLLSIDDLPADYDPARDDRVSEWEILLHLAKRLQEQGGDEAARLMAAAKAVVDMDSVRELAYLLFSIAEKRGWAETARLFNGLGTSWSDLADASRNPALVRTEVQDQLGYEIG